MKLEIRLDNDIKEFIEVAGCASHSSSPAAPVQRYVITKEALDKAFRLLSTRMSSEQYYGVLNALQSARPLEGA